MYIISVIPISRGIGKETLSYFTSSCVEKGALVTVPLRKKNIEGLVVDVEDARMMKSEIKRADFALRKIGTLVSVPFLSSAFMQTVQETAEFHACTTGAVLKILLPKRYIDAFKKPKKTSKVKSVEDRLLHQVVIAPGKKNGALLPSSIYEIPADSKEIILEEIGSNSYKGMTRPFIDFRFALRVYAKHIGARIIQNDFTLLPHTKKLLCEHKKGEGKNFNSLGDQIKSALKNLPNKEESHLFLLGTRTGAGTVLCQDCGDSVLCKRCNAPLTLHTKKENEEYNNLLCHHCGYRETAMRACERCGGWRLRAFGFGIEKIEEDVREFVKKQKIKTKIFRLDSTLKLTPKKITVLVSEYFSEPHAVLIATEIALPYLVSSSHHIDVCCIPSPDSLLALPDFNINQKLWRLLAMLDEVSKTAVIVQTRNPQHKLLEDWEHNNEKEFKAREDAERKQFNYPPHSIMIKISLKGKKEKIGKDMKTIENQLTEWKPIVFPAFIKTINNMHILHLLVSVPAKSWPDQDLLDVLLSLPPSFEINVNPNSLL